jgi:uncharacterized protein (DUF305 family)
MKMATTRVYAFPKGEIKRPSDTPQIRSLAEKICRERDAYIKDMKRIRTMRRKAAKIKKAKKNKRARRK